MSHSTDTTETLWFRAITLVASAFIAGYAIAGAVYFNGIRKINNAAISSGEATAMVWISVIIAIIALILFVWALIKLLFGIKTREHISLKLNTPEGLIQFPES